MPYHWVLIPSSPPDKRRTEVAEICRSHNARLCERQTYYDEQGQARVLIQVPDDEAEIVALLEELGATAALGLVDADEQTDGLSPPPSLLSESGD
jgi:hypothetical protein